MEGWAFGGVKGLNKKIRGRELTRHVRGGQSGDCWRVMGWRWRRHRRAKW